MVTGERCGWRVTATEATVKHSIGTVTGNTVGAKRTESACARPGDSGGPVRAVGGKGRPHAEGIVPDGGGGEGDKGGGLPHPCEVVFTDTGHAHSVLPGTVAKG